jgi:superfamily II DNA or RNA helicase
LEDDEFKAETIEDFSRPDTLINGLVATDILTRGFDVPDVMIGVSARPFSKSFSSHVQQMGRIMRPYDGKDYGLWLDHSGNYLRFRKEWDTLFVEGVTELQNGSESAKKEPDEKEKKEAKCPACGALWVWSGRECGECGFEKAMKQIVNVPGELTELEITKREVLSENQKFYSELLYYSKMRGYKEGWAAHKYKEKYGAFPRGLHTNPLATTSKTSGWIKSKNIAWAKSKANK